MFVHDVNLFVTVQLLDETPAVLSLSKLCEDHGYSCEWVKRSKVTIDQRRIISYLLSFQGYPPILNTVRLQHRYHKTR